MSNLDEKKPVVAKDEIMCSACWSVEKKTAASSWVRFKFKHLAETIICDICKPRWDDDMRAIEKAGL